MTKKRKIEILEMLKDEVRTESYKGLCGCLTCLTQYCKIGHEEHIALRELIHKYKPANPYGGGYFYHPFLAPPRIRLLNRIIKDIKEGKK